MIVTLILCALLCAITLIWIFLPQLRHRESGKSTLVLVFILAVVAISLYLLAGAPQLPSPSIKTAAEIENEVRGNEEQIRMDLAANPNDAEAMIRLAALHAYRGQITQETMDLLAKADQKLPGDKRIQYVRYYIETESKKP